MLRFVLIMLLCTSWAVAEGATVTRVIDGDTIQLDTGERVRYIGVDTPETVHPHRPVEFMGAEASKFNKSLVEGKEVRLELGIQERDRNGRLLAYVYIGDTFVNAELLRQGYAQVMTVSPNTKHAIDFLLLQKAAKESGVGLWSDTVLENWNRMKAEELEEGVYVSKYGKKYHLKNCQHVNEFASRLEFKDAQKQGYTACSVCVE